MSFNLLRYEALATVYLAQPRLFNLARGVSRYLCKNYLARTLVTRHTDAEVVYLLLGQRAVGLYLNYSRRNFTKPIVGKTDNRNILDGVMTADKVFYFNG